MAEKFAQDYKWYVDVVLNLIRIAGDYIADEVCAKFYLSQLIRLLDSTLPIYVRFALNAALHVLLARCIDNSSVRHFGNSRGFVTTDALLF